MLKNFLIFCLLLVSVNLFSQNKRTEKADATFESGEYYKALEQYMKVYDNKNLQKETKAYVTYRIAECYRFVNDFKKAEHKYKSAIFRGYENPLAYLHYGQMLKINQKYDLAIEAFNEYLKLVPKDKEAQNALESTKLCAKWFAHPTRYEITPIKEIDTKEGEFAPAFANKDYTKLYFTTTAKIDQFTKLNNVSGEYFTSILETDFTKLEKWSTPDPLSDTVNSPVDDGTCTLTNNFNTMYFTRCNVVAGVKLGCSIYKATRKPGEYWDKVDQVPLVADSISIGHPSISKDGLTLYFTAEIPYRGQGKKDIWKSERKSTSDKWGKPENLGPEINTPGNEVYPYIRSNGDLYFSSDYHPGLGGLDIFKAHYDQAEHKWEISNMRFPINSSQDDFGIIFKGDKEEGFFSSNRKLTEIYHDGSLVQTIRGKGKDDIYYFNLPPLTFSLKGKVMDNASGEPMKDVEIKIYGSDGTEVFLKTSEDGSYNYKLKSETDYIYVISKRGFLVDKRKISTKEVEYSKVFTDTVLMAEIAKPVEIPNIYYDFGKWTLKEESKKELDKLVDLLNANPNITIELSSHTDMVGDDVSNKILSQKRAQSVVDYLISKGVAKERLTAKGYGKSQPKLITKRMAKKTSFKEGTVLDGKFINALKDDSLKDEANQLNRRTEFKVLQIDYIPDY